MSRFDFLKNFGRSGLTLGGPLGPLWAAFGLTWDHLELALASLGDPLGCTLLALGLLGQLFRSHLVFLTLFYVILHILLDISGAFAGHCRWFLVVAGYR